MLLNNINEVRVQVERFRLEKEDANKRTRDLALDRENFEFKSYMDQRMQMMKAM